MKYPEKNNSSLVKKSLRLALASILLLWINKQLYDTFSTPKLEKTTQTLALVSEPEVEFLNTQEAIDTLISYIDQENTQLFMKSFVREKDSIWNLIAKHLLEAADRWVKIHIEKDLMGWATEWPQSMFGDEVYGKSKFWNKYLHEHMFDKPQTPIEENIYKKDLLEHPNITIDFWKYTYYDGHTYKPWDIIPKIKPISEWWMPSTTYQRFSDHSKCYRFGELDKILILTWNSNDEFIKNHDLGISISSKEFEDAFIDILHNNTSFTASEWIDLLLNTIHMQWVNTFSSIREAEAKFLSLLDKSQEEVILQTPYFGSEKITDAIINHIHNKPEVPLTIFYPQKSDVQQNLNYQTLEKIYKAIEASSNTNLQLLETKDLHHAKIYKFDSTYVLWWSNINPSSTHMWETNIAVDGTLFPTFALEADTYFLKHTLHATPSTWEFQYDESNASWEKWWQELLE